MSLILGILDSGGAAAATSSYESIQSINTSGVSTITFNSIPSGYASLQLRYQLIESNGYQEINGRFNGDTGSNYFWHYLEGNGSSASAANSGGTTTSFTIYSNNREGTVPTYPNVGIVDIHDYASTTKYKTVRTFSGADKNGTNPNGEIQLVSGLWSSTSAVTSLTIRCSVTWDSGTIFSLYGIKG
jgi:hypothetical protein